MSWLECFFFFFFKQKTAYEMRISDWSSDVCSSDLALAQVVEFMRPGCMASAALLADLVAQLAQRMHHPALQPALRQPCQYERDADDNTAGQPGAPLRARQHGTIGIDADVPGAVAGVQARG